MPSIPPPRDDELPPEVREVLANLPPLNIYRMLGARPASFRPFLELGGSLLGDPDVDPRDREILILRVAHATEAAYERAQHVQLARNLGMSDAEIEAISTEDVEGALGRDAALLCRVADEISRDVRLSDEALGLLLDRYGQGPALSLILCAAYYNMVSRFLESARVEIESEEALAGQTPASVIERGRSALAASEDPS